MPYLELLKPLFPVVILAISIISAYWVGDSHVQKKWDIEKAQLIAESNIIKDTAARHAIESETKAKQLNEHIEATADANRQIIESLATRDNQLIINRLQPRKAANNCRTVSSTTSTAKVGNDSTAQYWELSQESGTRIIAEAKRADELAETLRSCQSYVNGLAEVMK